MTCRLLFVALLLGSAAPLLAADPVPIDKRVDKVERELRAVQRKVFPSGAPAFTEPEIAAPNMAAGAGDPAALPLAELSSRVSTLERELARLTGQVEQIDHRLTVMSQGAAQDRSEFDARLKALETGPVPPPATVAPASDSPFRTSPAATRPARPATTPRPLAPSADETPATVGAPSADPAEAAYMAGYRLWADKKFDEAAQTLGQAATQYPRSRRASYARNLQGRAFLDNGQPAEAARILYGNYQKDPRGERAPESLFYLGSALVQLKKYDDACKAYGELGAVYGDTLAESLRGRLPAARKAARCGDDDAVPAPRTAATRPAPKPSAASTPKKAR